MPSDIGSGKMSSSPFSIPLRMARATDSGETFGMLRLRVISVFTGPAKTACTFTPRPAQRARSDCVNENAAAFEIEYAGLNGTLANVANAHRQNSSRGSGSGDYYCRACDAYWAHASLFFSQRLSYSSWRRHHGPGASSLRPSGARSSHWYMLQRTSTPRA